MGEAGGWVSIFVLRRVEPLMLGLTAGIATITYCRHGVGLIVDCTVWVSGMKETRYLRQNSWFRILYSFLEASLQDGMVL